MRTRLHGRNCVHSSYFGRVHRASLRTQAVRTSQGYYLNLPNPAPRTHARLKHSDPQLRTTSFPLHEHALQDCWAQDSAARPSMQEVVPRLIAIREMDALSTYTGNGPSCCTIC